jgi:hypothetical protein
MPSATSRATLRPKRSQRIVSGWLRSALYKSPPCQCTTSSVVLSQPTVQGTCVLSSFQTVLACLREATAYDGLDSIQMHGLFKTVELIHCMLQIPDKRLHGNPDLTIRIRSRAVKICCCHKLAECNTCANRGHEQGYVTFMSSVTKNMLLGSKQAP